MGLQSLVSKFSSELIANKEEISSDIRISKEEDDIPIPLLIILFIIAFILDVRFFGGRLTYILINSLASSSSSSGRSSSGGSTGGGGAGR